MKNALQITVFLLLVSLTCKSQEYFIEKTGDTTFCDIIIDIDGEEILAKVIEVFNDEIRYKKCDYKEGPTYSIPRVSVLMIDYQNGSREVIKQVQKNNLPQRHNQGFTEPSAGNAVVYFVRVNSLGFLVNFKYFDNDKFIGKFAGKNYMRYECSAGEHLFWISSEKKDFITADLKAGKTYIVIVEAKMGAFSAAAKIYATNDEKRLRKALTIVKSQFPIVTDQSIILSENQLMGEYIREQLSRYERKRNRKHYYHISSDSAIPDEFLH